MSRYDRRSLPSPQPRFGHARRFSRAGLGRSVRVFEAPSVGTARRLAADMVNPVGAERVTAASTAVLPTLWPFSPIQSFDPAAQRRGTVCLNG